MVCSKSVSVEYAMELTVGIDNVKLIATMKQFETKLNQKEIYVDDLNDGENNEVF